MSNPLSTSTNGIGTTKESKAGGIANALSMALKGVGIAAEIVTVLKKIDSDDGFAWLGMPRRKSPLLTVAILSAGAAIGAGIALWFAPIAGADLRSAIMGRTKKEA